MGRGVHAGCKWGEVLEEHHWAGIRGLPGLGLCSLAGADAPNSGHQDKRLLSSALPLKLAWELSQHYHTFQQERDITAHLILMHAFSTSNLVV